MESTIEKIAEDFSRHNFENTFPHINEDIQWHLIGDKVIQGKKTVIDTCNQSSQYLKTVTTKFITFKIVVSDNCVVIDSLADYIDNENVTTRISACDIYNFTNNKLSEITSYCIELKN